MNNKYLSIFVRALALFSLVVGAAACGDDGGGLPGEPCTDGAQSAPNTTEDPCPQVETDCAACGGTAIAMCEGSKWGACTCINCGGATNTGTGGTGTCSPGQTANCNVLSPGTVGVAMCNAAGTYDLSMCSDPNAAGGGTSG